VTPHPSQINGKLRCCPEPWNALHTYIVSLYRQGWTACAEGVRPSQAKIKVTTGKGKVKSAKQHKVGKGSKH